MFKKRFFINLRFPSKSTLTIVAGATKKPLSSLNRVSQHFSFVTSENINLKMSSLPPLSALAKFDDLMRCSKELTSGLAEESKISMKIEEKLSSKQNFQIFSEFLLFLHQYEVMRMDYQRLIDEAKDLQHQLDEQTSQTIQMDRKLTYARKLLELERKARKDAETDKAQLVRMSFYDNQTSHE